MRLITGKGRAIQIDENRDKLGAGGEGAVYKVGNNHAAKVYHNYSRDKQAKIESMLADPPQINTSEGHVHLAWPVDTLIGTGRSSSFTGFIMPLVGKGDDLHMISSPSTRRKERPMYTNYELHVIAYNIASIFRELHKKRYVVGDVNDRNVMINNHGITSIIDTDSFQVPNRTSSGYFRCGMATPEFIPPELHSVTSFRDIDRSVEHDLFGLGILLFKLLMQGFHPFTGVENMGWNDLSTRIQKGNFAFGTRQSPIAKPPKAPALDVLDPRLRKLFIDCFESGARNPVNRPDSKVWRDTVYDVLKDFKTCSVNKRHRYSSKQKTCPWCATKRSGGLDWFHVPQGKKSTGSGSQPGRKKLWMLPKKNTSSSQPTRPAPTKSRPTRRPTFPPPKRQTSSTSQTSSTPPPTTSPPSTPPLSPNQPNSPGGMLGGMLRKAGKQMIDALGNELEDRLNSWLKKPKNLTPPPPNIAGPNTPYNTPVNMSLSGRWYDPNGRVQMEFYQIGNQVTFTVYDSYGAEFGRGQGAIQGNMLNVDYRYVNTASPVPPVVSGRAHLQISPDGKMLKGMAHEPLGMAHEPIRKIVWTLTRP